MDFNALKKVKIASRRFNLKHRFWIPKPDLRSIQLNLTDYCPCKCIMCNHWKMVNKYEMSYSDVISVLTEAKELGCKSVIFSGGEPFMHKDFLSILNSVLGYYKVGIITSGIWPKKYYLQSDILKKISWIRLSIDSFDSDEYERIRGAKIHKALKTLEFIHGNKINSRINMCDLGQDYALKNLEFDVPYVIFKTLKYNEDQLFNRNKICIVPYYHCVVTANGNVYPCCYLSFDNNDKILEDASMGNVREKCFKDIWFSENANKIRKRLVKGNFFDICKQCRRYNPINTNLVVKDFC